MSKANLDGVKVQDHKSNEFDLKDVLKRSQMNGLFFGSSQSEPCKEFVKKLNTFKEELNSQNKPFQTILISSDLKNNDLETFFNWINKDLNDNIKHLKVKFDKDLLEQLYTHFCVSKIPSVIIIDNDAIILTQYGRGDIEYKNHRVYDDWCRMKNLINY